MLTSTDTPHISQHTDVKNAECCRLAAPPGLYTVFKVYTRHLQPAGPDLLIGNVSQLQQ